MISWLFCTIALLEISGLVNGASVRQASPSFLKELERAADGDIGLLHRNGYTLVQYREEGGEEFYRETWNDYRNGFGSPEDTPEGKGYWMGLDELHRRTSEGRWELIVVARSSSYPTFSYCHYKDFKVGTELYGYKLHLGERGKCTGIFDYTTVGEGEDVERDLFEKSNGATFSTPDHDNDESEENCAEQQSAGWWFNWDCTGFCANCRGALEYDGEKIITETHMGMKRIETDCRECPDGSDAAEQGCDPVVEDCLPCCPVRPYCRDCREECYGDNCHISCCSESCEGCPDCDGCRDGNDY